MKSESELQQLIQIEAAKQDCILLRNNSGGMKDLTGRMVRYGLGNVSPNQQTKSSDLIGITTVTITLDMVGQTIGVFTAIEVKKEDWNIEKKLDKHETFQLNFLNWVKLRGGLGGFCNSVDEIQKLITR